MSRFFIFFLLIIINIIMCQEGVEASNLIIKNSTSSEIINICIVPQNKDRAEPFFMRLDLTPNKSDTVENPDISADLRVDTGIQFWTFENVSLHNARKLIFNNDPEVNLVIMNSGDQNIKYEGRIQKLVPQKGDKPVCELTQFHPAMAMKDVCNILDKNTPTDDNGALITGLSFGGKVWAGRLMPDRPGPANKDSILEHMELRRPFNWADAKDIIQFLQKQGYTPWQAEFPNSDVDFADMPLKREQALQMSLDKFIENITKKSIQPEEATIMLAPASSLDALANADNPEKDVQLFTLSLRPESDLIILDVAAYRGDK